MAYYIEEKKNVSPNPCVVLLDYRNDKKFNLSMADMYPMYPIIMYPK